MKRISYITLLTGFILFLSGCSQGYRSNANHEYSIQQQQAAAQYRYQQQQKQKAHANNAKRLKQISFNRKPINTARPAYKPRPKPIQTSQQARRNQIVNQYSARNSISKIAHSTIGNPYKWGGNNPHQGFDCSGLMSYIHKNALGLNIPRTAAEQRDQSRTISYAELQPGDMLFFKTGENANHVGVYIGDRKFVHAATGSKQVKVASMDSSYWHKRFVKFGTFL